MNPDREFRVSTLNVAPASSLLDLELDQAKRTAAAGGTRWKTSINTLDKELPADLWTGGNIIGVASVDTAALGANLDPSLEVITTHLLEQSTKPTGYTNDQTQSVYIIAPPNQASTSIQRIYAVLNTRLSQPPPGKLSARANNPKLDAKGLLNGVSLLQYLDAPGLLESLSEVSSTLSSAQSNKQSPSKRTILLLQGLVPTINALHRRSGLIQTAALLSSILQSIRNIASASHGSCLVLVELDISWTNPNTSLTISTSQSLAQSTLSTAFTSPTGRMLRINAHSTLASLIESQTDLLIALHDADGRINARREKRRIVEVVRDERPYPSQQHQQQGQRALGRWCVWNG